MVRAGCARYLINVHNRLCCVPLEWPYDAQRQLVWETGATTGFWINVAQMIIFSTLAILAFSQLARLTKRARAVRDRPKLMASDDEAFG